MSMNSSSGSASAPKETVAATDPHATDTGLNESEVTRIRSLQGVWRLALLVATLATILLCINQQFALRFFIGYTQLNTEYFYLLIALMLPFTFLIFPGTPARHWIAFPGTTWCCSPLRSAHRST